MKESPFWNEITLHAHNFCKACWFCKQLGDLLIGNTDLLAFCMISLCRAIKIGPEFGSICSSFWKIILFPLTLDFAVSWQAVCCSDHLHCCPNGETCDVSQGKCIKGDVVSDWFLKTPAKSISSDHLPGSGPNPVQCNASVECPTGNTCCKLTSGQWGCCPLPQVSF